jgi:hypothetical protein
MDDPIIKEAVEALRKLSEVPQARELARARDIWAFDMATMEKDAREEGREECLKQSARLMHKCGIELVKIAKILEVPESKLEAWMRE